MSDFAIKQAAFETSVGLGGGFPEQLTAEIAMVGKSNVGKSSLINSLCNNYKLARTSAQPGKTRLINFFRINKSSLANEAALERFTSTYSGGINAVFTCGYEDYVSRRCFSVIKRRFNVK